MVGDKRCEKCGGKGGAMVGGRWCRCSCVNGTKAARDAMRRLNGTGATNPFRDAIERRYSKLQQEQDNR